MNSQSTLEFNIQIINRNVDIKTRLEISKNIYNKYLTNRKTCIPIRVFWGFSTFFIWSSTALTIVAENF